MQIKKEPQNYYDLDINHLEECSQYEDFDIFQPIGLLSKPVFEGTPKKLDYKQERELVNEVLVSLLNIRKLFKYNNEIFKNVGQDRETVEIDQTYSGITIKIPKRRDSRGIL